MPDSPISPQPFQSLYRRYRPQRFSEVRGQEHVVRALRNAVRESQVAHAYLFSGPRGTGKTSTARILAKALNCTAVSDGEPCCECSSCLQVQQGSSFDVHELDAASNNGVDAMRDLISRAALGTPGRWKVYIIDEVHMLSVAASNTLLKTLEEPPGHVIFVLATTDPQKVLPTIRSRTQHYEFRLLSSEVLGDLLKDVNNSAGLDVAPEAIDLVVRRGSGSARDALSVLDQVAASGGAVEDETAVIDELMEALCERDAGGALVAVAEGIAAGRDARRLSVDLLEHLRHGFLAMMAKRLVMLPDEAAARVEEQAHRLGAPALVRAMEVIGDALTDMREAVDPRASLEVALVRIARPDADISPAALLERIERLEHTVAESASGPARAEARKATTSDQPTTATTTATTTSTTSTPKSASLASGSRAALGALASKAPVTTKESSKSSAPNTGAVTDSTTPTESSNSGDSSDSTNSSETASSAVTSSEVVELSTETVAVAWTEHVLGALSQRARSRFRVGGFVEVDGNVAVYALPNPIHRDRCEEVKLEVEAVLSKHLAQPVKLRLVVDKVEQPARAAQAEVKPEVDIDLTEEETSSPLMSVEERVKQVFPGTEEVKP